MVFIEGFINARCCRQETNGQEKFNLGLTVIQIILLKGVSV